MKVVWIGDLENLEKRIEKSFGDERKMILVLIVMKVGKDIRGLGKKYLIYMGEEIEGDEIEVGNVMMKGVVKRDFKKKEEIMKGIYKMEICEDEGLKIKIKNMLGG